MTRLDGITDAMNVNLGKLWETRGTGTPGTLQSMVAKSRAQLGD